MAAAFQFWDRQHNPLSLQHAALSRSEKGRKEKNQDYFLQSGICSVIVLKLHKVARWEK